METSKLYQAITENREEDLLQLLDDENEDLKVRDSTGKTLLHVAVMKLKSVAAFKALLNKVDFTVRDDDGNSAIDLMLDDEDYPDEGENVFRDFVREKILGSKREDLANLELEGWLSLWMSDDDDVEDDGVKEFLQTLPKTNEKVEQVHNAVKESHWDTVKELLGDKALLKAPDRTGLPPLHKAVVLGQTDIAENIAREFVEALTLTDNMGRTALHHAAGRRDGGQLYQILTDAGAQEDVADLNGYTAKQIYEDPDILPGEKVCEKIQGLLGRPIPREKRKKQTEQQQQTDATEVTATPPSTPTQTEQKPPATPAAAAPKPKEVKPVQMYISPDVRQNPPPTTVDGKYVADHMGQALTLALAEIAEKRPWDPIEYLANWLYKYQENVNFNKRQAELLAKIREEEEAKRKELAIQEKRKAELKRLQEEERRKQQAEEEERKRREQEELQRKAKEAALSQQPGLATVMEDKEEDEAPQEKSHKDENGQTELHKLAAQSSADLTTLLNMGYSPAERDANNKTARDIAVEAKIQDNIDAIDKYVQKLVEMEEFDTVQDLILAGYDKFDVVLDRLKEQATQVPEDTQKFLDDIPELQERIAAVFKAVQSDGMRDLNQALERKKLAVAKDENGRSPLHIAVLVGHKEAVEHLATNFPITMKAKDNLERTPLHYAMAVSEEMVSILEKHGADSLAKDVKQRSPSFYRETPEEIQTMKSSLASTYTGTQEQSEQEPVTQQESSQQETAQEETSQQETAQEETSQQEATEQQQAE